MDIMIKFVLTPRTELLTASVLVFILPFRWNVDKHK